MNKQPFNIKMGGKALKVNTPRIPKEKYQELETKIVQILSLRFEKVLVPRYFSSKESFGDLDILSYSSMSMEKVKEIITELFSPVEFVFQNKTIIFAYEVGEGVYLQVDFTVFRTEKELYMAHFYQSYGYFGMIMGGLCKYWNLRFGSDGLFYNIYVDELKHKPFISEVFLSFNPDKIGEFFGFSEEFMDDFFLNGSGEQKKSEIKLFEEIYNSPVMSKSRISKLITHWLDDDPERVMLQRFNEFVLSKSGKKESDLSLRDILDFFEMKEEVDFRVETYRITYEAKKKFRSLDFIEITGIQKRLLGEFMRNLYAYHPEMTDPLWILNTPRDTIRQMIIDFHHL